MSVKTCFYTHCIPVSQKAAGSELRVPVTVLELSPLDLPLSFNMRCGELHDLSPGRMVSSNASSLLSQPHQPEAEQVCCLIFLLTNA